MRKRRGYWAAAVAAVCWCVLGLAENAGFLMEVISVSAIPKAPRKVYIYHTHTYEAYEPDEENRYQQTEAWRTADERYNIVRVGEELAGHLRAAGVEVKHDTAAYEPPRLSTA